MLPAYIRRMLVDGGPAGEALFRTLFDATVQTVDALERGRRRCAGPTTSRPGPRS